MKARLLGITAALALTLAAGGAAAQQKLKVGFIYVGPVGDHGWSYQHDVGRKAIEKELGDRVETTFVESVPEADSQRAIEQLARTGHGLIFTTSFGFMEPTLRVAQRFPNVKFEHATGIKRAPNLATYAAKFHEGRYIIGQIAGKMTKTGTIGYVGAFPIPEVVAGINAYMLGAQSVNPNVKMKVVWVNSWFDPAKEADAAKALLDQGVDVLAQHTDSPAPLQTAEARGKMGFGQATDMDRFAPKAQLTAIIDDWSGYYVSRVKAALDGTWKSGDVWGGLDSGMVVMAPYKNVPDEVKKLAEETEAAIRTGKLHPFKCPVAKQDGSQVPCEGGAALSDPQILGMNFYVKGIDDKLPQ
ncbi:MAG: ABC transporter, substrate-binding protein (cluster 11, riboflavin/purine nucleoside/unknown) [uncultured Microvirga sp.]|uniref:ABC transporter substrate-binding protein PnrA-like domain-containing protein n=1 Tax=uncultured Microvirga sp. TaxID=412392 RepID=A0A6J4KJ35_9HYPH|nr:MAG: ABC transporter, substrate-binding protein (cluster 11, riboflavin/purine nucleoside/unknown) [uncultured Microvirga sp.]